MKLKYYLRGLGIGMLVAALVLVISGKTSAEMSDEAVKRRAAELGMVEKDKSVLEDINAAAEPGEVIVKPVEETEKPEDSAPDPEEAAEPEGSAAKPEETAEPEKNDGEAQSGQAEETAQEIEQRAEEVADRAGEVAENAPSGRTITLEVRRGDSSVSVARRAQEAGLVSSAADFDVFLCRNGYDKRISIGSYAIAVGTSEKEIAEIITKSR